MTEPVAIVGMACRFPAAESPTAYWNLLLRGAEAVREPPRGRPELEPPGWLVDRVPTCRRGGFLEVIDHFEPAFFRISPREAARMDPQQRLLLEVAWEALEDAGCPVEALAGSPAGVFVGIMNADFARRHAQDLAQLDAQLGPGCSLGIASNRISFFLDARGPSMSIDTLCSSSLVAIHLACQSLLSGESTLAIAGGVNLILDRAMDVFYARAGLLSADGRCRSFDAGARGIVRGEGAALIVLKPLSRALADGDRVHALILGSAVNQDGRSNGLTSPSRWSQEQVLRAAYERAGVIPGRVSYVEAHGTGTLIGDPIEAAALGAVMGEGRAPGRSCAVGSVKSNLGHLESAAGVAGLLKAALSLSHRTLVPSLHFETPNRYARLDERGLRIPTRVEPWPDHGDGPLVAGVSSFGMGGTNAHIVLGAAPPSAAPERGSPGRAALVAVSAHSAPALEALKRSYRASLLSGADLADVAYSAGARRSHHDHRLAVVAASAAEAALALDAHATISGRVVPGQTHTLVLVFPEDLRCDLHAGDELAAEEPAFREAMERCRAARIAEAAERGRGASGETAATRMFALQVSLAALLRSLGVEATTLIGFGAGELAAAHVGGSLGLEEATRRLARREPGRAGEGPAALSALEGTLGEDSTLFIELSPRPVLLEALREILGRAAATGAALSALEPGSGERASFLRAIAALYCLGWKVDVRGVDARARFVALGGYPWQRERCWLEVTPVPPVPLATTAPPAPPRPPGEGPVGSTALITPRWERAPRAASGSRGEAAGEWLVVGDGSDTARAVVARLEDAGHRTRSVSDPGEAAGAWDELFSGYRLRGVLRFCGGDACADAHAELGRSDRQLAVTLRLLRALSRSGAAVPPRLWLVTRGAQVVEDDTCLASLVRSAHWGLGRVVANEHPRLRCTLVDLPPVQSLTEDADALIEEFLSDSAEAEVALRGRYRFVSRLSRQPLDAPARRLATRADAAYLITGGLGALGLAAAQLLVERGAQRLVLLGRRGVETDVQRAALAAMEAAGATLTIEQADVSDGEAMGAILQRHPVRGILHAAGIMVPSMISSVDPSALSAVTAAKIRGAFHLHEWTAERPLDFFVLYSSVATLLGTPGQATYAAANAYLDVLAQHRRAAGLPAISIAWTVIGGTGMAAGASAKAMGQLADRGLGSLSLDRATAALEQLLTMEEAPAHVGVAPFDLERWGKFHPHASSSARLAPLGAPSSVGAPDPASARRAAPGFPAQLRSQPPEDRARSLEAYLCGLAAAVLHHAGELEADRSLVDIGLDSLTALELQSAVEADLGIEVLTERLLRGPTLRELSWELCAQLGPAADERPVGPRRPEPRGPGSLRAEAQLDPEITPRAGADRGAPAPRPAEILLTGATGFLGAFVLHELLARTDAKIHCLVRAKTAGEGLARLEGVLRRYDLPTTSLGARVSCAPGDLARPRLGLSEGEFERLAGSLDAIVHSGASVNFVFPYEALRAANVGGTQEVLRLAASGRAKRVHHVSTIAVFPGGRGHLDRVGEEAPPTGTPERLPLGYMRAKWVAEELVREAGARGIATSIYRPGTISGHSSTGAFNPDDFLCAMIKGCVELGVAPRADVAVNLAPVDFVSRAIVQIALAAPPPSGAYHLVGDCVVPWSQLLAWLRAMGYPLVELPYSKWREQLLELAKPTKNALAPLMPLFVAHSDTEWVLLPPFDATRTTSALDGAGVTCPPVDEALFRRYVERFVQRGFLPPAQDAAGAPRRPPDLRPPAEGPAEQSAPYRPALRVREIPFDLKAAMKLEDVASLAADLTPAVFVDFLAWNLLAEFGETVIHHLYRTHDVLAGTEESRRFIQQELRHAGALHAVNRALLDEEYVQTDLGRLSNLCVAVRAPVLMRLLAAARDHGLQAATLREVTRDVAAFETTFGLLLQVPQFKLLRDAPDAYLKHPAFSYVTLYHGAEEAEHTHVSWEYYRDTYHEELWSPEGGQKTADAVERLLDDQVRLMMLVAAKTGLRLTVGEIQALPAHVSHRRFIARIRGGGFHPDAYGEVRRECVSAWDERWEPIFRTEVERRLAERAIGLVAAGGG